MLASGITTVVYLWKHMKRMKENTSSLSALCKKQQMRVTIMGIIQTVLFFFASGWLMCEELIECYFGGYDVGTHLASTVMALYSFGTTLLLGIDPPVWLYIISGATILFAMRTSFTASLGLQVCYFLQIVPVRWPCFIWMKKHIKLFMYVVLFFDRLYFLSQYAIRVFLEIRKVMMTFNSSSIYDNTTSPSADFGYYMFITDFWLKCCYFFICLGIMLASGITTVVYLWKHMKRMKENTSSLSALYKRQQMRVTIMGIIQTVLFFFASGWLMTEEFIMCYIGGYDVGTHLASTVMALYSLGTTLLLGIGQSKFRLTAKDICKKTTKAKF
ncbi:uncharacterized protein LOC130235481 [Danio aesculapii]|uniref:uncharacterized protein LOC130235481 n=1 Tax=Danio aesculapii TaxID=1142201 RepID=UPI0024C0B412|nr:uncharacterized protein LOC130235481 [Danio aesculapii]